MGSWFSLPIRSSSSSSESLPVLSFHSVAEWRVHFDSIKETDQLMVIDFSATWCGPCRSMEPVLKELASEHKEVVFVKIDVDELQEVARDWGVDEMPTFVLVKEGKEIERIVGARKDELLNQVRKHEQLGDMRFQNRRQSASIGIDD